MDNQQTDGDDAQLVMSNSISPSSSSTSDIDHDNNDHETHILVDDPALWPKLLTDREHCSVVKLLFIADQVKKGKYYSVIMDCIPDLSHKEQLSVVLRIVNCDLKKGIAS